MNIVKKTMSLFIALSILFTSVSSQDCIARAFDTGEENTCLINEEDLNNQSETSKCSAYLEAGGRVVIVGDDIDTDQVMDSLAIESILDYGDMFTSYATYYEAIDSSELSEDEYRSLRRNTFTKDNQITDNTEKKETIGTFIITNIGENEDGENVYDFSVVYNNPDVKSNEDTNDIIEYVNSINDSISLSSYDSYTLLSTWSETHYGGDKFKLTTSGKFYKQSNESDTSYDYYLVKANDYFRSGDYLYGNDYEINDFVLMMNVVNASNINVLNYYPQSRNSSNGNFSLSYSFADQSMTLSWSNDTGGEIDVESDFGTSYGNWGVFANWPLRLWLPESFSSEFATEFRVSQSDTSFSINHKIDVMTQKNLVKQGSYQFIDTLSR